VTTAASAQTHDDPPPFSIRVVGDATASVQPDQAQIDIGVTTHAQTSRNAATRNAQQFNNVLKALAATLGRSAATRARSQAGALVVRPYPAVMALRAESSAATPIELGGCLFVLGAPDVVTWGAPFVGLTSDVVWVWSLVRWPFILFLVILGIDLVYHFAPNVKRDWAWLARGSVVATTLWIASSFAFKLYVTNFADFNATHGANGGVIVILLWFCVSSFAILIGAEINGVIEQASGSRSPVHTP
jgi:hypothetical protein